jgi:hypothetical protein
MISSCRALRGLAVKRSDSGDSLTRARRVIYLGACRVDEHAKSAVHGLGVVKESSHVRFQQYYVGSLPVTLIVLAAYPATDVVLISHFILSFGLLS